MSPGAVRPPSDATGHIVQMCVSYDGGGMHLAGVASMITCFFQPCTVLANDDVQYYKPSVDILRSLLAVMRESDVY